MGTREHPLAYLITFTCYGARLPGDSRGTVSRRHNVYGTPRGGESEFRYSLARDAMHEDPFVLDAHCRGVVHTTVSQVCSFRKWPVLALNVRTNHVHFVVESDSMPEKVLSDVKAWCTRRLRERGLISDREHVWSEHGSTIYLWRTDQVDRAIEYVQFGQGEDLPHFDD